MTFLEKLKENKGAVGIVCIVIIAIVLYFVLRKPKDDKVPVTNIMLFSKPNYQGESIVAKVNVGEVYEMPTDKVFIVRSFKLPPNIGISFSAQKDSPSSTLPIWVFSISDPRTSSKPVPTSYH